MTMEPATIPSSTPRARGAIVERRHESGAEERNDVHVLKDEELRPVSAGAGGASYTVSAHLRRIFSKLGAG